MKSITGFLRALLLVLELGILFFVYYVMTKDVGISKAFTWHPILMTFGFAVCMNEGLIAYYFGDLSKEPRHDSRTRHGWLQLLSLTSILAGYVAIFIAHIGKSQIGEGAPTIKQIHVWLGYTVIALSIFQAIVGINKYITKRKTGESIAKWHGYLGLFIYLSGQTNIVIASAFWGTNSWNKTLAIVFIVTSVVILMTVRHASKKSKQKLSEEDGLLATIDKGSSSYGRRA
eukprot:g5629.t1